MLFVFLLDNDESMNEIKFPSNSFSNELSNFNPTSMDASIYFIQQYCKSINENLATARNVDENEKTKINSTEHRFIIFTFNEKEHLQLRYTWKDSSSILQEELKNISFESRTKSSNETVVTESNYLKSIAEQFEEFMEKFEVSYFNCTNLTGGHFILKESENVFVFCLSNQKWKLDKFYDELRLGWQRKNVFIQLHPNSYKEFCQETLPQPINYKFFPVTNLRDSDQLARTLCHANIYNSFDTQNMEILGKGGLITLNPIETNLSFLGLIKPNFSGKPKWPIPGNFTDSSWTKFKPEITLRPFSVAGPEIPKIHFDEYFCFCPDALAFLRASNAGKNFLSVQCDLGLFSFGYTELINENEFDSPVPLFKVFIGPFDFQELNQVFRGKVSFQKYLQNIPQFYEYFLHNCLGESKWNELFRNSRILRNEFSLPSKLIESKNNFKTSLRQKSKNDLALLVERAENSHKLRTSKRQSSYHPFIFPSLGQLKNDANHLNRLQSRFKNSLQIFLASCDAQFGCSSTMGQFQLPQVLFKHSLPVSQMTDFSEIMHKKRSLRPLFNENERDLFHILKEIPALQEEMATANFVSGDIFGNPYKKEKKVRAASKMATKRAHLLPTILDESEAEAETETNRFDTISDVDVDMELMSPMSIDEIDYKEMEDIENEIVINGSIVNLPFLESEPNSPTSNFDLISVQKWIKSPGGSEAKTKLIETLPIISNLKDLQNLLDLSKRFKRTGLSALISERIEKIKI